LVASPRSRSADIKLIAGATVAVILVGLFIFGALLIGSRSGRDVTCGQLNIGSAADIRRTLESGGPYFQTGGAGCGFWLALDQNDIVTYKAEQGLADGSTCTLKYKRDHWECGNTTLDAAGLQQYPVSIQTIGQVDAVIVDLRNNIPTTTTTAAPR
jgi:hypothetical protein